MTKRIEVKMAETDPGRLEDEANKQIDNNEDLKKDEKEDLRAYTKSVQTLVDSLGELDSFEGCICIVKTKAGCIQTAMFAPEYKFEEDWWLMRMAERAKEARGRHSFDKASILTSYFHTGDGSEENPFVITRPLHFYNMIYLYQRLEGFADEGDYFQLGY